MNSLLREIRYALGMLGKSPATTIAAIACIGLGIGATTTIFSVVNAILLRPFPFADPDRILAIHSNQPQNDIEHASLSYPAYRELVDRAGKTGAFSEVAAYTMRSLTLTGKEEPERVVGLEMSANLFSLLGVEPVLGRLFRPDEDQPGAPGSILLSHDLWLRRFGGDPKVVGTSILVNNRASTIVGVMPPRFLFPERNLAWVPLALDHHDDPRTERTLGILARLSPNATEGQARAEIESFAAKLATDHPEEKGWGAEVRTLRRDMVGEGMNRMVLTLMGMVLFVLLIACANVANLFLSRVSARGRELAVRAAIGAGRHRLVRGVLIESVLVGLGGGLLGVGLAQFGVRWMMSSIPADNQPPFWIHVVIDGPVLAFTAIAAIGTGILFGLAPAFQATGKNLQGVLKSGGRSEAGGRSWLRGALVVFELALALVLLVGAALMMRSFFAVQHADPGFDLERVMTLRIYLPGETYAEPAAKGRRVEEIVSRLESLPGVEAVAASNLIPLGGGGGGGAIEIAGHPAEPGQEPRTYWAGVTAHFFDAVGVKLEAGRTFTDSEGAAKAPLAVINQAFAKKRWPKQNPIGQRFRLLEEEGQPWVTVVGLVPDFHYDGFDTEHEGVETAAFLPYVWNATPNTGFSIRTSGPPEMVTLAARREIRAADPGLPVFDVQSLPNLFNARIWDQRFFGGMFSVFAGIALALAAIGVYGVLSYLVGQRRREIGVRVALGARRNQVLRLVVGQGTKLALLGLAIGIPLALGLSRVLSKILYGVEPYDPVSFATISILLAGVAILASYLPATRATQVDPVEALRSE
ncbi:MAG TPA: ABC transporter permease [Thermoanaerobaculia bacterium]|nr:ABC transporter permease [Thermoanaerobaculia bacterium]